ncbi:restriction endonuclease subunit S [Micromonospora sp. NPDC050795]|uniref:restriction endonuclease subunit S n=1 Tax=Micromonospora sp. NPDC050795 TaxID=3364282 RepID=UPI0037AA1E76
MNEARAVPIGELVEIVGGGTPTRSNPDYFGGDIPWVTPKDMKSWIIDNSQVCITRLGLNESAARLVKANSILVVVRSGVLKHTLPVGLNRVPVAVNQDMKALIPSDAVDPAYLARYIKAKSPEILSWVRATTADNFPIDKLRALKVPLPSMSQQRRVVDALDRVDALRASRREVTTALGELERSLFFEMFGDPAWNPKAWPIVRIGDLIVSATYGTSEKASLVGELPILRMGNLTYGGELNLEDLKYLASATIGDRYLVSAGDVLFNRTNSAELVGKSAIYRRQEPMGYAGYLVRLRVNSQTNPEYLAAYLNTRYCKQVLRGMAKSIVGMANINAKEVQSIAIPQPPLSLQDEFAARVAQIESLRVPHKASLAELDALFASLQDRAFRGEL